jgi:hypothetical protein
MASGMPVTGVPGLIEREVDHGAKQQGGGQGIALLKSIGRGGQ